MNNREKVLLLKDLYEDYKGMLNLTRAEEHEIEMWLEEKFEEVKNEQREKA